MGTKKTRPSKKKKAAKSATDSIDELKKKIKYQKNALTKIIKTYSNENET